MIEDAALLPFETVMSIFKQMMLTTYEYISNDTEIESISFDISKIDLGLQRIAEQNSIEYGLLVPVWSFYGTEVIQNVDKSVEIEDSIISCDPILVINAIDGTIIDPTIGY